MTFSAANLDLDSPSLAFLEEMVKSGRYGTASDVINSALRLLRVDERRLAALQDALAAGEASGRPRRFDFDEFLRDANSKQDG